MRDGAVGVLPLLSKYLYAVFEGAIGLGSAIRSNASLLKSEMSSIAFGVFG